MNKALIDSLLRHLLTAALGSLTAVMAVEGVVSPTDLSAGGWVAVLAALWAALVPNAIRYLNKKDPAFGLVAQAVASSVTEKLENAAKSAGAGKVASGDATTKKPATKKPAAKKPAAKKPAAGGDSGTKQAQ